MLTVSNVCNRATKHWKVCNSICIFWIPVLSLTSCNVTGLEELMTPEEKAKLYAAIGYSETAVDPTLPKSVSYN